MKPDPSSSSLDKRDWNLLYRWAVLILLVVQFVGVGVLAYAGKSYVREVAVLAVQDSLGPVIETVRENSKVAADFKNFKDQGPRFSAADAKNLKNDAVAEAVAIATKHTDRTEAKLDSLSNQVNEIRIMIAREFSRRKDNP